MPNWTHNVVTITGDAKTIAEIKALVQSDDTAFDFGKIIPIPESLLVESGGMESIAIEMASSVPYSIARENAREKMQKILPYTATHQTKTVISELKTEDDVIALGKVYLENKKKYGYADWYDWCCNNWGTKWNACNVSISNESATSLTYDFDTAWSEPTPVLQALSEKYPNVDISTDANYEDPEPWVTFTTTFKGGKITSNSNAVDEDMCKEYEEDEEEE